AGGACTGCAYAWSATPPEVNFPPPGDNNVTVTGTPGHTYTVTVTSPDGCSAVPASTTISSAADPPDVPTCNVLFASPSGAGDGLTPTSPTTIQNALAIAGTNNILIKMQVGLYSITSPLVINCNNQLEGGYYNNFTQKTSDMSGGANTTVIRRSAAVDPLVNIPALSTSIPASDPAGGTAPRVTAVIFPTGSMGQHLQDLRIEIANAAAGQRISNYGVYVGVGVSNYQLVRCYIASGNAS